jgi:membrane-associated phospholipid phosphatase
MIPFNEYFAIFYYGWYALVAVSLFYFFFYDAKRFKDLQIFIIITQALAVMIYIVYPTVQIGRPEILGDNIFCDLMRFMYTVDTPTGVCPSLHVAYSLGIVSVWVQRKKTPLSLKCFVVLFSIMVCLSVVFVKQHSVIDVFAGFGISVVAEYVVYKQWYKSVVRLFRIKRRKISFSPPIFH